MEFKKRFSFRKTFIVLYSFSFLIYLGVGFLPAEASRSVMDGKLEIPAIDLVSDVEILELENGILKTPDFHVGSFSKNKNKIFLIGHSTTVFQNLNQLNLREKIIYHNKVYKVVEKSLMEKSRTLMSEILKAEEKETLMIMTCAGELLDYMDATHRLIIRAVEL